jgi:hypothetical protein
MQTLFEAFDKGEDMYHFHNIYSEGHVPTVEQMRMLGVKLLAKYGKFDSFNE